MTVVTEAHFRQAIEICEAGGTEDHPYEQQQWGSPECGTPCCVWGHAMLVAGARRIEEPRPELYEDTPAMRRFMGLSPCPSPDILRVMRAVETAGAINLCGFDLRKAALKNSDLQWADWRGANLRGADLRATVLRWATLREADLRGADLSGAILR